MNYLEEIKARIETLVEAVEQLNAEKELFQERVDQQRSTIYNLNNTIAAYKQREDGLEKLVKELKKTVNLILLACCFLFAIILGMGFQLSNWSKQWDKQNNEAATLNVTTEQFTELNKKESLSGNRR